MVGGYFGAEVTLQTRLRSTDCIQVAALPVWDTAVTIQPYPPLHPTHADVIILQPRFILDLDQFLPQVQPVAMSDTSSTRDPADPVTRSPSLSVFYMDRRISFQYIVATEHLTSSQMAALAFFDAGGPSQDHLHTTSDPTGAAKGAFAGRIQVYLESEEKVALLLNPLQALVQSHQRKYGMDQTKVLIREAQTSKRSRTAIAKSNSHQNSQSRQPPSPHLSSYSQSFATPRTDFHSSTVLMSPLPGRAGQAPSAPPSQQPASGGRQIHISLTDRNKAATSQLSFAKPSKRPVSKAAQTSSAANKRSCVSSNSQPFAFNAQMPTTSLPQQTSPSMQIHSSLPATTAHESRVSSPWLKRLPEEGSTSGVDHPYPQSYLNLLRESVDVQSAQPAVAGGMVRTDEHPYSEEGSQMLYDLASQPQSQNQPQNPPHISDHQQMFRRRPENSIEGKESIPPLEMLAQLSDFQAAFNEMDVFEASQAPLHLGTVENSYQATMNMQGGVHEIDPCASDQPSVPVMNASPGVSAAPAMATGQAPPYASSLKAVATMTDDEELSLIRDIVLAPDFPDFVERVSKLLDVRIMGSESRQS